MPFSRIISWVCSLLKHTRQPSVTEAADVATVERRKKCKADYEQVVRNRQQNNNNNNAPATSSFEFVSAELTKEKDVAVDGEIRQFTKMVMEVRAGFRHDDPETNRGLVISPRMRGSYPPSTSVKCVVFAPRKRASALNFTCDGALPNLKRSLNFLYFSLFLSFAAVTSTVEHITMEVVCNLETDPADGEFFLQVAGTAEYLEAGSQLQDYEYVHQCYKYDRDPEFVLLPASAVRRPYLRTVI